MRLTWDDLFLSYLFSVPRRKMWTREADRDLVSFKFFILANEGRDKHIRRIEISQARELYDKYN